MTTHTKTPERLKFGLTQCVECGDLIHQDEIVPANAHLPYQQVQEHTCSTRCRDAWLRGIRAAGL